MKFLLILYVIPALALLIIPQNWSISFGSITMHSWQIYLSACGLPVLCAALCFGFFPESPKFLMSQGRDAEALAAFQTIYAINKGCSRDMYPVSF